MKRALVLIKPLPHYRRDSFEHGLRKLGYTIVQRIDNPDAGDVVVTWNLTGGLENEADRFAKVGASVLVVENGYLTPPGETTMYALAKGGHAGAGKWPIVDPGRWDSLGIPLKAWRRDGKHIVVCAQRGIGSHEMASPWGWHEKTAEKIRRVTRRPVRVRTHPGGRHTQPPVPTLQQDLANAWAMVIWSSSAGVHSLVNGIPVFYAAPHWTCSQAALPFSQFAARVEDPLCLDASRLLALNAMANSQWSYLEIASGEPLKAVIEC